MLSLDLRYALERDVVGQPRAVRTLVRAVTVSLGELSRSTTQGIYLLIGPNGTGKTHVASCLARVLHGPAEGLVRVDCVQMTGRAAWPILAQQLAPHLTRAEVATGNLLRLAPRSILLLERIEQASPEFVNALIAELETGQLVLPDGSLALLDDCLVLMTSNLCSREIYEAGPKEVGFSRGTEDMEESEKARIYQHCLAAVEKCWGHDFVAHLDDLVVFHRLREPQMPFILRRLIRELNDELAMRQIACGLSEDAMHYLLARGSLSLRNGAWLMVKVFRRFVRFPVADLLCHGDFAGPGRIDVGLEGHDEPRLRFELRPVPLVGAPVQPEVAIPIAWE